MSLSFIDSERLNELLDHGTLIRELKEAFTQHRIYTPPRNHLNYGKNSTLLLMPSIDEDAAAGVKLITVNPDNPSHQLPSIQGVYVYFDRHGTPRSIMDAKALTSKRTAATSALASTYLSKEDSRILLVLGTGAMAPELIRAHSTVRDIDKVLIWGRDHGKAQDLAENYNESKQEIIPIEDLESGMKDADIISSATMSVDPLILGKNLNPGQHVDLVGSYKPEMREADDELIKKSRIYIDSKMAIQESGDIRKPIENGILSHDAIEGTLFDLCQNKISGRKIQEEITCFKSVGLGLEDLVAANIVYSKILNNEQE